MLVYFDISNGPPAFQLGALLQRAVVRQGTARCAFTEDYADTGCRLTIAFTPQAATVQTEASYGSAALGRAYRPTKLTAAPAPPCLRSLSIVKAKP